MSAVYASRKTIMRRFIVILMLVGIVGLGLFWLLRPTRAAVSTNAALESILVDDGSTAGFARATVPGAVEFPRDLGPHEAYQTEWWYYTGNLTGADGRPFGFQFTIFRSALTPQPTAVGSGADVSEFRTNQVYLAHFTVSDIANEQFYAHERFSRGAAGLAGAQAVPYRVWLEDWSVAEVGPGQVQLTAVAGDVALNLTLTETLPPVLHGDGGLSAKGEEPGNASYYYSIVQQRAAGTVAIGDEVVDVTGLAWKDHEYSTSALSAGSVGWDWFSLQFDNGTAVMFFQIRREDGTLEPASSGSFITAGGEVVPLAREDWQMEVRDTWTSPTSGGTYPAGWRIVVPKIGLDITGAPQMPNQELNVSTVYWEGAVAYRGELAGEAVTAVGYTEMTGYAAPIAGNLVD